MGREGIQEKEVIRRGVEGRVYLTPDNYESGREAQRRLAMSRTPTGYFEIPEERLEGLSELEVVGPHNRQPGGGLEQYVEHRVDASGLTWREIES